MTLGDAITISVLKGYSCVGASLCSLRVSVGFCGRARFEVSMIRIFIRMCCCLSPWWEVGLEMEEPEPGVCWGFSYAQWLSLTYQGEVQVPRCWSRTFEGLIWAHSISSKCTLSPLLATASLPQRGTALEQNGARVGIWHRLGHVLGWSQHSSQSSRLHPICCLREHY